MPVISRDYIICICLYCSKLLYAFLSALLCVSMRGVEKRCFLDVLLEFFEWNMVTEESLIYI